ncbi:hypothetical protein INS49_003436 [Diaporthe citri]|uniref:uncharacterized protein n=1 Tax=Diaporthe citri TaxID=83186 RepID=UPI001C81A5A5|nr:uncharacterized protein INS49_003436 [Diaporthe citri]KAG6355474.1 hypothetical protein INS49_003436 [Diaporthe citri]
MQARNVATPETAPRSTTIPSQSEVGQGTRQQGTSHTQDENMLYKASRAGGPSEQASIAPSIPSWLYKLPSEVSGYSSTDPSALGGPHTPSGSQPNMAPRPSPLRPARPSRASDARGAPQPAMAAQSAGASNAQFDALNDLESVGPGSSVSQRSSNRQTPAIHQTSSVRQPSSARQTATVRQKSTVQQTPTIYQNPPMQQMPTMQQWPTMPQFARADGQAPVVNNFHHNYSPTDSRQNFTANSQQYHTDNGYHQTTYSPHVVHTHNNQRHIFDNSRRDTITQSMETLHLNSSSTSAPQPQRKWDVCGRTPSETLALRGARIKCKRGLFFDKGITTHQHVPDSRPC